MKGSSTRGVTSSRRRGRVLALTVSGLAAALALSATVAAHPNASGDKWTVKLRHGGTFSLAKSIRDKVAKHQSINYVFSYGSCSIQGFSEQYQKGYEARYATEVITKLAGSRFDAKVVTAFLRAFEVGDLAVGVSDSTLVAQLEAELPAAANT